MSNSKLSPKEQEELNKLEHKALEELYYIIAIAYQVQDIEYINSMISAWKQKYKKIIDNPSTDFRKKFEKILKESYSKLVNYILSQIKLKEEKMIENQRKALTELYRILKDNYDLNILKEKIKKWESKYPYDAFLKMYQNRIDSIKREKNLKQYAFDQETAFKDLYYGVVNRSGTIKDLKEYLHKWEEKYYINDKFTIDHFIKHQSEVKRYVSDDFLISIAKKDEHILDTKPYDSSSTTQDAAFKKLDSIIKKNHNVDEVFKWVYKNNSIEFNDFYKQRIINIIALDYSPKYLKTLPVPDIDLAKLSLPIEQYSKINEIKRYAIISYFNLLLPKSESIPNNFFTEYIKTIYNESQRIKRINIINTFKDEVTDFVPEILNPKKEVDLDSNLTNINISSEIEKGTDISLTSSNIDILSKENTQTTSNIENNVLYIEQLIFSTEEPHTVKTVTHSEITEPIGEYLTTSKTDIKISDVEEYTTSEPDLSEEEPIIYESNINVSSADTYTTDSTIEESQPTVDYDTIIAFSPVFFETINNYSIQADLVQTVANRAAEKSKVKASIDKSNANIKARNQSE